MSLPLPEPEGDLLVQRVRSVLKRRKRLVLAGFFAVMLPVVVITWSIDPVYEASTSLIFDEVSTPMPNPAEATSREVAISNRMEELGSYAFAAEVASTLPRSLHARFPVAAGVAAGKDTLTVISKMVREALTAAPLRNSNVIRISAQLGDPELCVAVANSAAQVAQDRNSRIRQQGAGGVRRFVEQQLVRTQAQLEVAENALRDYKAKNRISVFDSEAQEILRRATDAEVLFNSAQAERGAAEEQLASVGHNLNEQKRNLVPSVTEATTPAAIRLKERLGELQSQQVDLRLQNYPPTHPKMQEIQQQIDATKRDLTAEMLKLAAGDGVVDPLAQMQKYATDAAALQIQIESSKAQERALRGTLNRYDEALGQLPEKEYQLARLTRDRDVNHKIYSMLLEKLEEARIGEAERLPTCRIIDAAQLPKEPIRPRKALNLGLGFLLAGMVGCGLGLGWEAFKSPVESSIQLERLTGWPVLASIPRIDAVSSESLRALQTQDPDARKARRLKRGLIGALEPNGGPAEAFRMLRTSLQFQGAGDKMKILLLTSAGPSDGKSTTLANLAIAFAAAGQRVLVLDGEVRRPVQHLIFGVAREPGLTESLRETAIRPPFPTQVRNLEVLPTGGAVGEPGDAIVSRLARVREVLDELRSRYDLVLIDTPPVLLVHDTALFAKLADAVVLVVNSNRTDREILARARQLLASAGANVVGTVLNHVDPGAVYGYRAYGAK